MDRFYFAYSTGWFYLVENFFLIVDNISHEYLLIYCPGGNLYGCENLR